jgi:hypothetical protein
MIELYSGFVVSIFFFPFHLSIFYADIVPEFSEMGWDFSAALLASYNLQYGTPGILIFGRRRIQ